MKKGRMMCAVLAVSASSLIADEPKLELKPYGFLKGDMYVAIGEALSWGKSSITCASRAGAGDTMQAMSFSAQHSRLGLKGAVTVDEVEVGGVAEVDFFTIASNANGKPRMRLGYAWCKPLKGLEIRAGQDWDLFSPLNPTTNNTNANLWYNGNYGFRRPQLMVGYTIDAGTVKPSIKVSAGEAAREDELTVSQDASTKDVKVGTFLGSDNLSMIPMLQGRIGAVIAGKADIGVGGVYAAYGEERDITTGGINVDISLALHKLFALKGEFGYGKNFNNANLFTVGGSGTASADITNIGFWFDATSKPVDFLNIVAGFGDEIITSDLAAGAIESNMTVFGDLIFPMGKFFSLAVEYQLLMTTPKDKDAYIAHVIDIAGKVTF